MNNGYKAEAEYFSVSNTSTARENGVVFPQGAKAIGFQWRAFLKKCCATLVIVGAMICQAQAQLFLRDVLDGPGGKGDGLGVSSEGQHYNLKAGPVLLRMTAGLRTEYNDNIALSNKDRRDDYIITPQVGASANWAITSFNALSFGFGAGYSKYLNNPGADSDFMLMSYGIANNVNTGLNLRLVLEDFTINVGTSLAYSQGASDSVLDKNGEISTNFGQFTNASGFDVLWNLANPVIRFGYKHNENFSWDDDFQFIDNSSENFTASTTFNLNETMQTGIEGNASLTSFDQEYQNDSWSLNMGPFFAMQVSQYLGFRLGMGLTLADFEKGGLNGDDESELSSYYFNGQVYHIVNQYLSHNLSLGKSTNINLTSNFVELYFMRYGFTWNFIKNFALSPSFFFDWGDESGGVTEDDFYRWGASIGLGYQISKKLTSSVGYTYISKDSDMGENRDYYQNRISLDMNYQF